MGPLNAETIVPMCIIIGVWAVVIGTWGLLTIAN